MFVSGRYWGQCPTHSPVQTTAGHSTSSCAVYQVFTNQKKKTVKIIFFCTFNQSDYHFVVLIKTGDHGKQGLAIFSGFKFPGAVTV